ncbi:hypothetical protein FNN08_13330 [Thalassomonas sp. M1454]|nr:hypothetical protein FNN08_13330 [Thalassomonas sp. M1454]
MSYRSFLVLALLLLSGCSVTHKKVNQLSQSLNTNSPEAVLTQLQTIKPKEKDRPLFNLNIGTLQFLSQDYPSAITSLTLAKEEMAVLYATSITENIGAATVNETMRSYSGTPSDLVMVHNLLALSYLFNNDPDSARVEILQADIMMKKLIKKDSNSGQLASAHLISAVIYELLDEQDNALISYKFAAELMQARGTPLTNDIKLALTRLSKELGILDQFDQYKSEFGISDEQIEKLTAKNSSALYFIHFDGVVTSKKEVSIMVPSYHDNRNDQLIRIAMPSYPNVVRNIGNATIDVGEQDIRTSEIENVNTIAREDLDAEYPAILLATTSRAVLKYDAVKNAEKKDPLAGFIMNVATVLSESADVRSWNMLPASIQYAYVSTGEDNVAIRARRLAKRKIALNPGSKHVILTSSISDKLFHYQQEKSIY